MTETLPPAIVMGLSPTGLHVVRALGRSGVKVIGIVDEMQAGAASRFCKQVICARGTEKVDRICEAFPKGGVKPVLIPTSDQDVDLIIQHAERLKEHVRFQASYADGLAQQIMDKDSFYRLCETHGVAYPRLWSGQKDQVSALAEQVAFPCMIKPALIQRLKDQMRGKKGWIARDEREYQAQIAKLPPEAGTLLGQEIVPGPESDITLWCGYLSDGAVLNGFTARKLRQFPPGFGSASLAQSHPEPESTQIAVRLLQKLGYRGVASAEFKRDPKTGALKIIEINVRPSLWFSLTTAAGRQVVLSAYRDLAGLSQIEEHAQIQGVRWCYGVKDLYSRIFYARNPGFILPSPDVRTAGPAKARTYAVFAWGDPLPAVAELWNFARKALRRLIGRRS